MNRRPESFNPCVWESTIEGRRFTILVCADSYRDSGGEINEAGGKVVDELCHPVAIRFGSPVHIHYGFRDYSHEWLVRTVAEVGLSRLSAQRALAETWRGVEDVSWPEFPRKRMTMHFRVNKITSLSDCEKPQEKTMFRNVNAWVRWDSWQNRGLTSAQKANDLSAIGIPATEKGINKMLENIGLQ
jgi:hypothetical protein